MATVVCVCHRRSKTLGGAHGQGTVRGPQTNGFILVGAPGHCPPACYAPVVCVFCPSYNDLIIIFPNPSRSIIIKSLLIITCFCFSVAPESTRYEMVYEKRRVRHQRVVRYSL